MATPVSSSGSYKVQYWKDGQKHVIRRTPPPKLHPMEVKDEVTITRKRNADWDAGEVVTVKGIHPRAPNTLQVEKEDGTYTFLAYFDVKWDDKEAAAFEEKNIVEKDIVRRRADPIGSDYLLWP